MALSFWPSRACKSPTVLFTVRSLGSALRIFSYSAMALGSLPCWTNFSAVLRTFCLLKPKPNAIRVQTPAPVISCWKATFPGVHRRVAHSIGYFATYPRDGLSDKGNCKAGYLDSYGY